MKKALIVTSSLVAIAIVGFYVNGKIRKKKFDSNCLKNGGVVEKSGMTCNYKK